MSRGFTFSFHVGLVMAAFAYVYLMTMLVFIDRWFGLGSDLGTLHAVVYSFLAVMCATTYRLAMFTDPGRVPESFVPNTEDPGTAIVEIKRKGGHTRFCQKCSQNKPPRCHHCRICNRCVLRMDHHCVWINNCVGHANYKYFFVLVAYAAVASLYSMVLLFGSLTVDYGEDANELIFRIIYIITAIFLLGLSSALVALLCWNIYLVSLNKTQIEYFEGARSTWHTRSEGPVYSHPYDVGADRNITWILGPTLIDWICPTTDHIGTGLRFPTRYDDVVEEDTDDEYPRA